MKKKFYCLVGAALLIGLVFAGCGSAPKVAGLTGVTSYYVRADGDDKNAGINEDMPFKTLSRAVEAVAKTTVKKITVIGTLKENVKIEKTDSTIKLPTKFMDATDGKSIEEVMANQVGVAMIDWSLDEQDPDEIFITGKPGTSGAERAILIPASNDPKAVAALIISNSTVRLANIEISGVNSTGGMSAILLAFGTLTLEQGTKITKNVSTGASGIFAAGGVVIMRDNAEISGNEGKDNVGLYLDQGSIAVMSGKALISGNKAANNGGGIALQGSSLLMYNNAAITDNSAGNGGGGIVTFPDTKNGYISQITMSGNAAISGNTAKFGGGIVTQGKLIMNDNAKVTENTATERGGGVFGMDNTEITMSDSAVVSGNTANQGGGLFLQDSKVIIFDNATITGNTALEGGGGVVGIGDNSGISWGKGLVITDHITGNTAPKQPDTNFTFD